MTVQMDGAQLQNERTKLVRWLISSATLSFPQAAGPVAFSLAALALTGQTSGGAAMILAMTLSQVVGTLPLTRVGRKLPPSTALRVFVTLRTIALGGIVLCTALDASFLWLIVFAAAAGGVNGAAFGFLRTVLNQFTPSSKMPRALGIAATFSEVTFVLAPVIASGVGAISPTIALIVLTVVGALPALLIPRSEKTQLIEPISGGTSILNAKIAIWLTCAAGGAAAVGAIEIGAVAMALNFGYEPSLAILFTVPLCVASVAGGIWVSYRNRLATPRVVVLQLSTMTLGSALAALHHSLALTIVGAVLIGLVLAPLSTNYSLVLDQLAPPSRRPEIFALLRTASAVGLILVSTILTVASISTALICVALLMSLVTLTIFIRSLGKMNHRTK